MNDASRVVDATADLYWEKLNRTRPEKEVRAPVWSIGKPHPETHSCIIAPGNMDLFLSKLESVKSALLDANQTVLYDQFSKSVEQLMEIANRLYGLQLPLKRITEYNLSRDERTFLDSRVKYPLFNDSTIDKLRRLRVGRALLKELGVTNGRKQPEIVSQDVLLEFPASRAKWPPGITREILDALMTKRHILSCDLPGSPFVTTETEWPGMRVRRMPKSHLEQSFGAYEMTFSLSFVEPLRYYCEVDPQTVAVVTQDIVTPSKGFLLSAIYRAYDLTNQSIVSNEWQRVLSIRMRQILECTNELGWVIPTLGGDSVWIDLDRGVFPVLLDLSDAFNANNTRVRYPLFRPLPRAAEQAQIALLMHHGSSTVSADFMKVSQTVASMEEHTRGHWLRSFREGINDLQSHAVQWTRDAIKRQRASQAVYRDNNNNNNKKARPRETDK